MVGLIQNSWRADHYVDLDRPRSMNLGTFTDRYLIWTIGSHFSGYFFSDYFIRAISFMINIGPVSEQVEIGPVG
jgi:hypothetical protein